MRCMAVACLKKAFYDLILMLLGGNLDDYGDNDAFNSRKGYLY